MRYLLLLMAIICVSCGTQKSTTAQPVPQKENRTNHIQFYEMIGKKSSFDAVKISSKIDIQLGKNTPTIDATIYIENQQKIWMNMQALFINVARGVATPQGLKAYEKIERTYIDSDYFYLNNLLNINFLDYQNLQNLLVGKPFLPIMEDDYTLITQPNGFTLKSKKGIKVGNPKQNEYLVEWQFYPDFSLSKVLLKDSKTSDNLEIYYNNWAYLPQEKLPRNVKIIIKGKKNGEILIENTKFDFSKMDTPYNVPNHYKKRELQ